MKKALFIALSVLACSLASAQVKITGGPYLQNVTETEFTLVWTTNMDAVGWVEIAPDDGTHFYNTERPAYYDLRGAGRKPIGKLHKVTIKGLTPGTTYRYRAMNKGVISQEHRSRIIYTEGYGQDILKRKPSKVKTLSPEYDKVRFAMVNDVHENDSTFRKLFNDAKGKYDFVCFNGDMTSDIPEEEALMKHYLKSAGKLFAGETPLYMVRGNHEYRGNAALKFLDYIQTPTGKTYYAFKYGKFFFLALDGGEDKPDSDIRNLDIMITKQYVEEEALWLKSVVESDDFKNAEVRIAFCHMAPDEKGWYGNATVSKYLVPTLNEAGIDLMLCGHIHTLQYDAPGTTTAAFPVLSNDNLTRLEAEVSPEKIGISIFDPEGKLIKTFSFNTKQYLNN